MTIYYSLPGKVMFSIVDYIGNVLDDIPEDIKGKSSTPAAHQLFYVAEYATKLYQTIPN